MHYSWLKQINGLRFILNWATELTIRVLARFLYGTNIYKKKGSRIRTIEL